MSSFVRRLVSVSSGTLLVLSLIAAPVAAEHGESTEPAVAGQPWWHNGDNARWRGGGDGYVGSRRNGDTGRRGWGNDDTGDWSQLAGFAANNGKRGGFWVLTRGGKVFAHDGAPTLGRPTAEARYVAMASHPRTPGYWVLDETGRVYAFGTAKDHGSARFTSAVSMAVHKSGQGYWIASRDGRVRAFGSAKPYGGLSRFDVTVDRITSRHDADGYELRTTAGRWFPFPNEWLDERGNADNGHGRGNGARNGRGPKDRDRAHRDRIDRDRTDRERAARERAARERAARERAARERAARERTARDRAEAGATTGGISKPFRRDGVRLATVRQMTVAYSLADNLLRLMRHAERDGRRLGGWGFRSTARQIELRRAHCGTSRYAIYEMPSSQCSPPTARPGSSMHEKGLAIDFYKRGRNGAAVSIGGTRESRWLKRHASRYGLYNLPSEPWHWSTNGR